MAGSRLDKTRALRETARRQYGVATTQQAVEAGFSHAAIGRAVATGEWGRIHHGIYVVDPSASSLHAAMFGHALRARGSAWVSHDSAAWLWELDTTVPVRPHISTTANLRGGRAYIHRLQDMPPDHVTYRGPMPVTTPARTLVDLAATAPARVEGLAIEAVRARLVTKTALGKCVEAVAGRGQSGARRMRHLLDLWGSGGPAESVLESRLLRVIRDGGLPTPHAQFEVRLANGVTARLDFAYPRHMVAIEADGYRWHGDPNRWRSDLVRRNELTRLGWRTLHFTWNDIRTRPHHVVATVRAALEL
ncbi:MAG TPA: type IV toxin-antitoxin system AbiEi family antitoxin domain-containing protein, partial [Actinomycetota bacterium]|nr:type IV toxin-antitoxin system AbiEi family antitoxin domain-containing protein [Actinomycetota bacterium]